MSYILDALRKADAERERGEIPGLHAQAPAPTEHQASAPEANHKLIWMVAGATALLTIAASWLIWGRSSDAPPPAAPTPMSMMGTPQMSPNMAPHATPSMPPVTPAPAYYPPVAPAPETPTAPPPAPPAVKPGVIMGSAGALPTNTTATTATNTAPTLAPSASSTKTEPRADKAAKSEASKLYKLMELPESVRRDLPTLTIGGAMYSEIPAQRMLIINSQVLREGDTVATDLVLETVQLKSAIFRFRGYRYLVNY